MEDMYRVTTPEGGYEITCPYCFKGFKPKDVHFRSINGDTSEYAVDEVYEKYRRAVNDSQPTIHRAKTYSSLNPASIHYIGEVPYSLTESDGINKTYRRICPFCHNPLPRNAGLAEELMVALVGDTQSGKTVLFLSIMRAIEGDPSIVCGDIRVSMSRDLTFDAAAGSDIGRDNGYYGTLLREFLKLNLPATTPLQGNRRMPPIVYDVEVTSTDKKKKYIVCLYDMPGELLDNPLMLEDSSNQIRNSDAMIFMIDPVYLPGVDTDVVGTAPEKLNDILELSIVRAAEISGRMANAWGFIEETENYPYAVTVTKSDAIKESAKADPQRIPGGANSIIFKQSQHHGGFDEVDSNAVSIKCRQYLEISALKDVVEFIDAHQKNVKSFMLSALGKMPQIDSDGNKTIDAIEPIRVLDPLFWILYRKGIIPPKPEAPAKTKKTSFFKRK